MILGKDKFWITKEEIFTAYRKLKADLYFSGSFSRSAMVEYEEKLTENLEQLYQLLKNEDATWVEDEEFLGSWYPVPSKVYFYDNNKAEEVKEENCIISDPWEAWERKISDGKTPTVEFRIMADTSIQFMLLSSLWILKIGHKFDAKLGNESYGNRLRRNNEREIVHETLGFFEKYFFRYRKWRKDALEAMEKALDSGKEIITITSDLSAYYHNLNPDFLMDPAFLGTMGVELDSDEEWLNILFIKSIKAWAAQTPLKKGLPVGVPASAVVANIYLSNLDTSINEEVVPLFYGRYVDDVILVLDNRQKFRKTDNVRDWLLDRLGPVLVLKNDSENKNIYYTPPYGNENEICFGKKKTKIFFLKGNSGKQLIKTIERQMEIQSSEWRALPILPKEESSVTSELVKLSDNGSEVIDNLRKADIVSMDRSKLSLLLRDFEAFSHDLPADEWSVQRKVFFEACIDLIMAPGVFWKFYKYLFRVLGLTVISKDFAYFFTIIKKIENIIAVLEEECVYAIKGMETNKIKKMVKKLWEEKLKKEIHETAAAYFPSWLNQREVLEYNSRQTENGFDKLFSSTIDDIKKDAARYFQHDLYIRPFKTLLLPKELNTDNDFPVWNDEKKVEVPSAQWIDGSINKVITILKKRIPKNLRDNVNALYLPTRPVKSEEVSLLFTSITYDSSTQDQINSILKHYCPLQSNESYPEINTKNRLIIKNETINNPIRIAVTSWIVEDESFISSVKGKPDLSVKRYRRLTRLINAITDNPVTPNYIIMPELAIPAIWFIRVAEKLRLKGISFITGVEYIHRKGGRVNNQIWASLVIKKEGMNTLYLYRQDKQQPAWKEERDIFDINNKKMSPQVQWRERIPPIIQHGDFYFALLVCSELTNISYRNALRGNIDALFVPEWNKDINTFNSLVESSALDMHTYIIQCNNRSYGDSRIRGPYKEDWELDIVRLKGGKNDFYVMGEIDIDSLRLFQSNYRSVSKPYKPIPDGFKIASDRKMITKKRPDGDE